ncbi:uncharacterized protein LOC116286770 [Actinia tenebrosa]|uniref:Uncharacterized protein LOC116286770 n=1 Tax=Actinia tenebrosa TaxID=6105 RepID=A0A6P8H9P4_ACTTE|nr:uncharacterized protein LOC116286770 [Actinia tenebrosa]
MSDLKVWVDGKERVIRGVSQNTTCESVVLVLAKAAGKSGKVALLEKWGDFERILPRNENPLKCLEAWGTRKKDVRLVLEEDDSQEKTIDLSKSFIKLTTDNKYDLIKRSVDCGSLENFTALQQRKLKTLSRALEILDFQLSCWDDNDEKFLYLTEEEIIEDFSLKLSQTVKLQAKELNELHTLQTELNELQHSHENSTSKFESFSEKFSQFESEIADTYNVVEKLLIRIENCEGDGEGTSVDVSSDLQNEIRVLQLELHEQQRLSVKQDKELKAIQSSVSELTKAFQLKTNQIEQLRNEITSEEVFYDLDEHFRPLSPEEEPFLYEQCLSSDSVDNKMSSDVDTENITKDFPEVKTSGSNGSNIDDESDIGLPRRSSSGSPEEFFKNWSTSTRLANSPLNYFPSVNGVKASQSNPPKLSSISKIESQTSERKRENGINESENVNGKISLPLFDGASRIPIENSVDVFDATETISSKTDKQFGKTSTTGKEIFPLSRIKNKDFPEGTKSATLLTQKPSSLSLKTVQDTNAKSASHFPKASSTIETKLHKETRKNSTDDILSVLSMEKDKTQHDISKISSKHQTNPKPFKNSPPILGLPNFAKSSTLNKLDKANPKFNSEDRGQTEKLPPPTFPKPWRKSSTGSQGTARTVTTKPFPDKAYLLPPTAKYKGNNHRNEKPLSRGDLCEEGVFV